MALALGRIVGEVMRLYGFFPRERIADCVGELCRVGGRTYEIRCFSYAGADDATCFGRYVERGFADVEPVSHSIPWVGDVLCWTRRGDDGYFILVLRLVDG